MIKFNKIESGTIFTSDFSQFAKNNKIDFGNSEQIAVIYGPNGAGKTSLTKVLSDDQGTKVEFEYDNKKYSSGKAIFHIINDQNNRNIINGETKDFFLGDNIRHEFELQTSIEARRKSIIDDIIALLKSHGISAANSPLIDLITLPRIAALIKDIANNKSKGRGLATETIIETMQAIDVVDIPKYSDTKLQFLQNDLGERDSIIRRIQEIDTRPLIPHPQVHQIEENTEAINILSRFHKDECIVCDTKGIDWKALLASKTENRTKVIDTLDEDEKKLIEKIIELVSESDPFQIKTYLIDALSQGNNAKIVELIEDIKLYSNIYCQLVLNDLAGVISKSELPSLMSEYQELLTKKPEITEEDMLFIDDIISNSMNKQLSLERERKTKNLRLYLSNQEFLGKDRNDLPLSSGEQNFLSLTFEFLKAKNSACPIVLIDDPISSFDSIYKNKVAFAVIKILHDKKRIILTHNTDLLRLLNSQYSGCYNLYLLNNTDGEENGFIALSRKEQEMLISLHELLQTFRHDIFLSIENPELFLISLIPFMRGYAHITKDNNVIYEELTEVMHGYKTKKVNVSKIYRELFEITDGALLGNFEVSVSDILSRPPDEVHILDQAKYPLLDKTLRHSFAYLFLRLKVEKALVTKFGIDTTKNEQLGQIISAAYPNGNDLEQSRNRIKLTSKKTLINEFNHFEGNLSIFQPAIDITDQALRKEIADIETFVNSLKDE